MKRLTLLRSVLFPPALAIGIAVPTVSAPVNAQENGCHPSYIGACVPIGVEDVDCLGGNGDGPYYVGRVIVVGPDVYRLDTDGDGIGCENAP